MPEPRELIDRGMANPFFDMVPSGGATVALTGPEFGVSPGQACVFYDGGRVLGGGWIRREETAAAA